MTVNDFKVSSNIDFDEEIKPIVRPTLNLHFSKTKKLDSRVSFSRNTTATYYDGTSAKAEENLFSYSQEFDNAYWGKIRSTITANDTTAPDGTLTAEKLIQENGNTAAGVFNRAQIFTLGTTCTFSIYAKAEYYDYIILRHQSGDKRTWFNVSNGTIGTSHATHTASIEDVGNGWYRCSISFEMPIGSSANFSIYLAETDNLQTVTAGTGFNGVYIWGAQIEEGSFPTSYIKTTGSQVTRSADDTQMYDIDQSEWFKQGTGTLLSEVNPYDVDLSITNLHYLTLYNTEN